MKYRVDKVNSWNGWDPLKQVILGNCYSPEWFRDIKDTKLRGLVQELVSQTQEDLDGIQRTLEDLNIDVVRIPENTTESGIHLDSIGIDSWGKYHQYLEDNKKEGFKKFWKNGLPKPMITPRDYFITLGNRFVQTTHNAGTQHLVDSGILNPDIVEHIVEEKWVVQKQWEEHGYPFPGPMKFRKKFQEDCFPNWTPEWDKKDVPAEYKNWGGLEEYHNYCHSTWGFWAPMVTRVGETLVVDTAEQQNLGKYMIANYPEFSQSNVAIGGHNDGTFCTPKPGLVINADPDETENFKTTFPGWDIFVIEDPETVSSEFKQWQNFKGTVDGRWWQKGAEALPSYVDFVDQWLNQWVGYVEETVFEVNMLSIDPETILCLNKQDSVHDALKSRGINPIYTRFRHRKFWDGGLHCLTVDTVREGSKQNYFE